MTDEDIERNQYDRINELSSRVDFLAGQVETSNKLNAELVKLLRRESNGKFGVIIVLIAALIYMALGPDGYNAVRDTIPTPWRKGEQKATASAPIAPWHDDFDGVVGIVRVDTQTE